MATDLIARGLAIKAKSQYSTLPTASANNVGLKVQYTGPTTGDLVSGYFYEVIKDGDEYKWQRFNVQPSGSGAGVNWGEIVGSISNQTDLSTALNQKQNQLTAGTGINLVDNTISIDSNVSIAIYDERVSDANQWLTNGYTKTSAEIPTINLPPQCTGSDRWGVLLYVAENNENKAGLQQYFPIDGTYKGRVFYRSVTGYSAGIDPEFGDWELVPWSSEKQDVISDLSTIRSGAALGATAVQPSALEAYRTSTAQDVIDTAIKNRVTAIEGKESGWDAKSTVSASASGSSTNEVQYITINNIEYKLPSGTQGTTDYTQLTNKPQINGVELNGNKSLSDLGIQSLLDAKVNSANGTLTGTTNAENLIITGDLTADSVAVNNSITVPTPTDNTDAANKGYVDDQIALQGLIGRNFTTDITVGHLAAGTVITADMKVADILYSILYKGSVPVTGVQLNKSSTTINTGSSETLTATVLPTTATNKSVTWSSSAANIASVNSSGVVSGLTAGSAIITVTTVDGGFTATCNVTVETAPVTTLNVYMGGAGNDDEQEDPSESDLANMTTQTLSDESALIGQHAWHIVTGNSGNYSQYPAFVVPNTYSVTAWSMDLEGAYPVSAINTLALSNNLTMYYAPDPLYDFPEGAEHYLTISKITG